MRPLLTSVSRCRPADVRGPGPVGTQRYACVPWHVSGLCDARLGKDLGLKRSSLSKKRPKLSVPPLKMWEDTGSREDLVHSSSPNAPASPNPPRKMPLTPNRRPTKRAQPDLGVIRAAA